MSARRGGRDSMSKVYSLPVVVGGGKPPPPFPDGWYRVALSHELPTGKLLGRLWLGQHIVAWRDAAGVVCVAAGHCPHMGALMTPDAGGRLVGDRLQCPFHRFEFDTSGRCVSAGSVQPRNCALSVLPVQETNGFIFAWWDNDGHAPDWTPPQWDETGFTSKLHRRHTVSCHPQDTHENVVDMPHFLIVHGFDVAEQTEPSRIEGPLFVSSFRVEGRQGPIRREAFIRTDLWGLGIAMLELRLAAYGGLLRLWFLTTPVRENELEVEVISQFLDQVGPDHAWYLRAVPEGLRRALMRRIVMWEADRQFRQDTPIWNHKAVCTRPRLTAADGDILMYRRWCARFYPGFPERDRARGAAGLGGR